MWALWRLLGGAWERHPETGHLLGLDYAKVAQIMWATAVRKKRRAAVFEGVREMEAAALEVLAERR